LERTAYSGVKNSYIKTPAGRIRYFIFNRYNRRECGETERESKNTPIQGCNADIIKIAMYYVHVALLPYGDRVRIVNVIHDELNLECPTEIAEEICKLVIYHMEEAGRVILKNVPVVAEGAYGSDWSIK